MKKMSIFMLAGESSGDQLGATILDGLSALNISAHTWGIGGPAMMSKGFVPQYPMDKLTIMGLGQAITSIPRLFRLADTLIDMIVAERPDVVLTIDSKGFSFRFARRLKKRMAEVGWSVPVVHLVAPTVWAWGRWRAATVAKSVDHLLCLFPFETPYFHDNRLKVTCVGHPAADRPWLDRASARELLGIEDKTPLLLLLPGSRRKEVEALLPDMLIAAQTVREQIPSCRVLLPAADTVRSRINAMISQTDDVEVISGQDVGTALSAANFGLICSGTVTLEAALAGMPGAVYYRGDALAHLLQPLLVQRENIVLPNAIMGEEIYPLFLNKEFNSASMAATALAGLRDVEKNQHKSRSLDLIKEIKAGADSFGVAVADALSASIRR
jgi:lipid-A-disaccharide synthase